MFGLTLKSHKNTLMVRLKSLLEIKAADDREIKELRDRIQGLLNDLDRGAIALAGCNDNHHELLRTHTGYQNQVNNFWWAISQRQVAIFTDADSHMGRTTHRYTVFFKPRLTRPGDNERYGWDGTKREEIPEEWAIIGKLVDRIGLGNWWWDGAECRLHKTYYEIPALLNAPADIKAAEEELQEHLNRAFRADEYRSIMEPEPEPVVEDETKK